MRKKQRREFYLLAAVLWTVAAVLWTVNIVLRRTDGTVLTVLALLAAVAACVVNWNRYIHYKG